VREAPFTVQSLPLPEASDALPLKGYHPTNPTFKSKSDEEAGLSVEFLFCVLLEHEQMLSDNSMIIYLKKIHAIVEYYSIFCVNLLFINWKIFLLIFYVGS
tara:strand:- start:1188 stop:1490 length:303 start_codon:yes stop_codon:yes gene_type:complete